MNNKTKKVFDKSESYYNNLGIKGLRMGIPQPNPYNKFFTEYSQLLKYNPNNIGTNTRIKPTPYSARFYEYKLMDWIRRLYHDKSADGYVCSGATEGNIMGLWIGREKLSKKKPPVVIAHVESHNSIRKACDLLNIKLLTSNESAWNKPLDGKMVNDLLPEDSNTPVIVVITIGHTSTGIIDNIKSITSVLRKSKRDYYIHVDAAIDGFILPFIGNSNIFDFCNKDVSSITTDFHKYGLGPYPSGVFLCRKNLQKFIEREAEYGGVIDDTLIGSRSGAISVLLWANVLDLGQISFKENVSKIFNNKKYFLSILRKKSIKYITSDSSPSLCFLTSRRLPQAIEHKFRLFHTTRKYAGKNMVAYTIFFYADTPKSMMNELLSAF